MRKVLPRKFFDRPTLMVARELLGKYIVRRIRGREIAVMITEVEAYDGPRDLASHASRGLTPRTRIMFGPAGHFYIYFTYGMHWLANVVTGKRGYPAAVLLRAGGHIKGPALLTRHLKIDGKLNGIAATRPNGLWFEERLESRKAAAKPVRRRIKRGKRIGVDYAGPIWAKKLYNFKLES